MERGETADDFLLRITGTWLDFSAGRAFGAPSTTQTEDHHVHIPTSHRPNVRAAASTQWARAFAIGLAITGVLSALGACSDQPTATTPARATSPHREVGTARSLIVTSTSGGSGPGTLAWALANALQSDTVRFDPRLAGDTIAIDSTLRALNYVTIEGPADKGSPSAAETPADSAF